MLAISKTQSFISHSVVGKRIPTVLAGTEEASSDKIGHTHNLPCTFSIQDKPRGALCISRLNGHNG